MSRGTAKIAVALCLLSVPVPAALAQDICDGVSPVDNTTVEGVVVATGIDRPLLVTAPPGDRDRIFIVEQDGRIRVKHRGTPPGTHSVFMDITPIVNAGGNEQGVLGMAFDPDYETNGFFYLYYTRVGSDTSIVSRFSRDAGDPDLGDPTSETVVMAVDQPQSNHNGGHLIFDTNGNLLIGLGDGGGRDDEGSGHSTCGNGQDTGNLPGSILRIDPSGTAPNPPDCASGPYSIPADNPLVDGQGGDCDEIYAYGLRNPWRFDVDPTNNDVYIADVGQDCWEEVNHDMAADANGANYGWRSMEGDHCFDPINPLNCSPAGVVCAGSPSEPCNDPSLHVPVHELSQGIGVCSITGGHVYRGCRMAKFNGTYFYGDYCDGNVRSFEIQGGAATNHVNWGNLGFSLGFGLTSFGRDAQGEIYVCDRQNGGDNTGEVIKLLPPFSEFEVSGAGVREVEQFLLHRTESWTWEDLEFNSMHPVDYYSVYRGQPGGTFDCIHSTLSTEWPMGGDPTNPDPGGLLAYLVTATDRTEETMGDDPPRDLNTPCSSP
jgi:glucose/arabinose dehydrogenase